MERKNKNLSPSKNKERTENSIKDSKAQFIEKYAPETEEIKRLNEMIKLNHDIRNQMIRFSYTTVFAVLAAALAIKDVSTPLTFLFLMPFAIMIPFQARISYYRLDEAHIRTYLTQFASQDEKYRLFCRKGYYEDLGINEVVYKTIAWLVNHELVVLSISTTMIFYLKYFLTLTNWTGKSVALGICAPLPLLLIVWVLSSATYSYIDMVNNFEWTIKILEEKN